MAVGTSGSRAEMWGETGPWWLCLWTHHRVLAATQCFLLHAVGQNVVLGTCVGAGRLACMLFICELTFSYSASRAEGCRNQPRPTEWEEAGLWALSLLQQRTHSITSVWARFPVKRRGSSRWIRRGVRVCPDGWPCRAGAATEPASSRHQVTGLRVSSWPPLVGPKLEAGTEIGEAVSYWVLAFWG